MSDQEQVSDQKLSMEDLESVAGGAGVQRVFDGQGQAGVAGAGTHPTDGFGPCDTTRSVAGFGPCDGTTLPGIGPCGVGV